MKAILVNTLIENTDTGERFGGTGMTLDDVSEWVQRWIDRGLGPRPGGSLIVRIDSYREIDLPPTVEQQRHDELVAAIRR